MTLMTKCLTNTDNGDGTSNLTFDLFGLEAQTVSQNSGQSQITINGLTNSKASIYVAGKQYLMDVNEDVFSDGVES